MGKGVREGEEERREGEGEESQQRKIQKRQKTRERGEIKRMYNSQTKKWTKERIKNKTWKHKSPTFNMQTGLPHQRIVEAKTLPQRKAFVCIAV